MNANTQNVIGTYDVIVVGGGAAGVAAAKTAAEGGASVVLIEPTGSLGREIVRARNLFVDLSRFPDVPAAVSLLAHLEKRKGWFDGKLDTNCAAAAFDDMLDEAHADVLFQVWASGIALEGGKIRGLEVASKSGYGFIRAPHVIDASMYGKISRSVFKAVENTSGRSMIRLLYNNVPEMSRREFSYIHDEYGSVNVTCEPTFWPGEWRVSLEIARLLRRDEWSGLVDASLSILRNHAPELADGVLTYIADDVWSTPECTLAAEGEDNGCAAVLLDRNPDDPHGTPVELGRGMLTNPKLADGLVLSGSWIEGFPAAIEQEQLAIINLFKLGETSGKLTLESLRNKAAEIM
ncbi:FAD-dependent oxidoreductase [Paenibacillus thalictri]|uniref:FAD-dependent oxidoreductase n=1 Tax=Paenibacillus thalictri TaxID=2527873 RepID=A0A4Q9DM51_9BACL|nr:FAD-dependent oxidoreductase [Paenibacillus thalictri]TBL75678.1 FAD-dependent oxidoreductase [Paenibacillus thalictri]